MITSKNLTIPIFDYKLTVVIFDKWEELEPYLSKEQFAIKSRGITIEGDGAAWVAVGSKFGSTITHESVHIKNCIWKYIGYKPQVDNDEVDAYLVTYIYNKITDVYYKHGSNSK